MLRLLWLVVSLWCVAPRAEEEEVLMGVVFEEKKALFLRRYEGYGYPNRFESPVAYEAFVNSEVGGRLKGDAYLDYAGSALYTNSQVDAFAEDLKSHVYGNPHSLSSSATRSTEAVESAREEILSFLGASSDQYEVIFTRSCTDSLRLVADAFPWSSDSKFKYLLQNHNSVLGIREVARARGAQAKAVSAAEIEAWLESASEEDHGRSLFAYPGEENFAGEMFPLGWAKKIVEARDDADNPLSRWSVLIDGAKFLATHPINLTETPVDFLTMSFYKLFGSPTGVGALVTLRKTAEDLTKCYFGGGSVTVAGAGRLEADDLHVLKSRICERFEDGTVSFLGIAELKHGFKVLNSLGGPLAIEKHTKALASYLDDRLRALEHVNNKPVVVVYGPENHNNGGPVVNFNVIDAQGHLISHIQVMEEAARAGIHIRAGAECNPGAAYEYLGVSPDAVHDLATNDNYLGCGTGPAFITCQRKDLTKQSFLVSEVDFASDPGGSVLCEPNLDFFMPPEDIQVPLGSLRASLGYLSTFQDVDTLANFIDTNYRRKI